MYNEIIVMTKNWLKTAIDGEQATQDNQATQQGAAQQNAAQQGDTQQKATQPSQNPAPTPTAQQKAQSGNKQRAQLDAIRDVVIPDVARRSLPALNQSLYFLVNELRSRDDLKLSEDAARKLAIAIMEAWLGASRSGTVSDLGSVLAKSPTVENAFGATY